MPDINVQMQWYHLFLYEYVHGIFPPQLLQMSTTGSNLWILGGRFKNTYELLNLRALKFSYVNKIHIFQCMG